MSANVVMGRMMVLAIENPVGSGTYVALACGQNIKKNIKPDVTTWKCQGARESYSANEGYTETLDVDALQVYTDTAGNLLEAATRLGTTLKVRISDTAAVAIPRPTLEYTVIVADYSWSAALEGPCEVSVSFMVQGAPVTIP